MLAMEMLKSDVSVDRSQDGLHKSFISKASPFETHIEQTVALIRGKQVQKAKCFSPNKPLSERRTSLTNSPSLLLLSPLSHSISATPFANSPHPVTNPQLLPALNSIPSCANPGLDVPAASLNSTQSNPFEKASCNVPPTH